MNRPRRQWRAAAALLGLSVAPGPAADEIDTRADLARVSRRVGEITRELNSTRSAHQREVDALREVELRRAVLGGEARRLEQEVALHDAERQRLGARVETRRVALAAARSLLARHARIALAVGRRGTLELVLGQGAADGVSRALALHRYFRDVHARELDHLGRAHAELAALERQLDDRGRQLDSARADAAANREALAVEQIRRARALAALEAKLRAGGERLTSLKADAARLQQLLRELDQEFADIPFELGERAPFATLRGALSWPVAGIVTRDFGATGDAARSNWPGVHIEAAAGSEVRAVAGGRVAYADWLRGFGLMLIVEHDDHYMSLYGHGQSLFKEVGEWVEPDEVVAVVGNSGGAQRQGLYFEIRHRGEPLDPAQWIEP